MLRALVNSLSLRKIALLVTLAGVGGCTLNTEVSGPAGIVKVSGDQQSAAPSTTLPTPLAVAVFTQFGERIQNITVFWTITSGGGTLSAPSTQTDDTGVASVNYTTGPTEELVAIRARAEGLPSLTFNVTVKIPAVP